MPTLATVIIPTFNRAHLVRDAIDSTLQQATRDLEVEVIVVDDGSTDATSTVLESYGARIRALTMPNRGASAARNTGIDAAQGAWVKFLDSDDVLLPGTLAKEAACGADAQADIVVSGWGTAEIPAVQPKRTHKAPYFHDIPDDLLAGRAVPASSALYARDLTRRVRWDESLVSLDDWDYFCSAALHAQAIVTLDCPTFVWREHEGPRLTQGTMLRTAIAHHYILGKLEAGLRVRSLLTVTRQRRLAQYLYKELRVLALHDAAQFHEACVHIERLDPHFQPRDEERHWYMRLAARVLGFRTSTRLHCELKRMLTRRVAT